MRQATVHTEAVSSTLELNHGGHTEWAPGAAAQGKITVCVIGCSLVYLSPGLFLPGDSLESAKEQEKTEFSGLGILQKAGGPTMIRLSLQEILRRAAAQG